MINKIEYSEDFERFLEQEVIGFVVNNDKSVYALPCLTFMKSIQKVKIED